MSEERDAGEPEGIPLAHLVTGDVPLSAEAEARIRALPTGVMSLEGWLWGSGTVPSEDGYGGIHGDCPYCGEKLMWTGWGWSVHSEEFHAGVRRRLLRAVRDLVAREAELKAWQAENDSWGFVGIRWRNGVYWGWQSERRSSVAYEMWDRADREEMLRWMRSGLTDMLELEHGVRVNPATWFHRVYDARQAGPWL